MYSVLSGRFIFNIRQASPQQITASGVTGEENMMTTLIFGENSQWQFRVPGTAETSSGEILEEEEGEWDSAVVLE